MKNIILATTALVATAGVAAAEVSISGYGRFGAVYTEGTAGVNAAGGKATAADVAAAKDAVQAAKAAANAATTAAAAAAAAKNVAAAEKALAKAQGSESKWKSASRLRFQFDASVETDSGVTFSARQRFQTEENGTNGGGNGARFGMSYNGFTLQAGNITGVIEATPNLYMNTKSAGVGLEGNGFSSLAVGNYTAYSSAGKGATDGVEIMYNMNGVGLHAHSTDTSWAVGANYTFSGYTGAIAYEEFDGGASTTLVTIGGNIGEADVAFAYGAEESKTKGSEVIEKFVLKGGYNFASGVYAYGFAATGDAGDAYGLGVSYDLGGGASLEAGWTQNSDEINIVSIGAFFRF